MSQDDVRFFVVRRNTLLGQTTEVVRCGSFVSHAKAELFIIRSVERFQMKGTDADRWWCQVNDNLRVEYWIETDVDALVKDLLDRERRLIEAGDDGSILEQLARRPLRN